ncbi:MAG: hypothetical protein L0Y66_14765 [Myxococcaceae bacterium]|nr:hypothetical protein [Myxococcaceae bacterium]
MSFLPESASFEERVQDYFLALRGRGLSLSTLDRELLGAWAAADVPFEVVARGLKRAAEGALFDARPGEPLLRSLRACRRQVEAEIRKHVRASTGRGSRKGKAGATGTWEEARLEALRAEVAAAVMARPELGGAAGRIHARWLGAVAASAADASRQEDAVHLLLCRALPAEERRVLWRQVRLSLAAAEGLTAGARRISRRVRLGAVVRRVLDASAR